MNIITLVGNVGRDPEQRTTPSGAKVTTFSVADNHVWTDKDGKEQKETSWLNVECWNGQGEAVMKNVKKGRKVTIVGRLAVKEYEDKNTKQKKTWVVIENARVEFDPTAGSAPATSSSDDGAPIGSSGPDPDGIPF